jgi:UDP-N-acetylmuramate dehydrogenase
LLEIFDGKKPSLKQTRQAVCEIRARKAMLVRQGGLDSQSAGSFFKNPIVSNEHFAKIAEEMKKNGVEKVPNYPFNENSVKISAAWLIENSGFRKGFQKGRAGLSTKHTLAITNRGGATAEDILNLQKEIQLKVSEKFKIELVVEPVFVGF